MTLAARRWLVAGAGTSMVVAMTGLALSAVALELDWVATQIVVCAVVAVTVMRVPESRVSWVFLAIVFGSVLSSLRWSPDVGTALNYVGIFGIILPGLGVLLPLWFLPADLHVLSVSGWILTVWHPGGWPSSKKPCNRLQSACG